MFDNYANKLFEIDYWGLSNVDALRQLIKEGDTINVCNLGLMDLTSSKKMLNEEESKKIVIQGQDFEKCSISFLIKFMFIIQNLRKNTNTLKISR